MKGDDAYAISRTYTKQTAAGMGAVKGKSPQVIKEEIDTDGNTVVTLRYYLDDGTSRDTTFKVQKGKDGKSIQSVEIVEATGELKITYTDGTVEIAGTIEAESTLESDLTATVAMGSVVVGKKYPIGTPLETIIRDMLIKEEAPAVTVALNPTKTLYDAVSETLSTIVISATVTKKTYPPTKITFYVDDEVVNEKTISAGGTFSYTHNFAAPTKEAHTFKAVVTDGKLSGSASKSIKFVAKSYYGIVASDIGTPTEAQIKGLANNVLKDTNGLTYSGITTDFGKVCYAYPKEFGALASIKDTVNNYNYTDSFSKATVSVDGIEYLVYTQTEPSAADNVKLVFA